MNLISQNGQERVEELSSAKVNSLFGAKLQKCVGNEGKRFQT